MVVTFLALMTIFWWEKVVFFIHPRLVTKMIVAQKPKDTIKPQNQKNLNKSLLLLVKDQKDGIPLRKKTAKTVYTFQTLWGKSPPRLHHTSKGQVGNQNPLLSSCDVVTGSSIRGCPRTQLPRLPACLRPRSSASVETTGSQTSSPTQQEGGPIRWPEGGEQGLGLPPRVAVMEGKRESSKENQMDLFRLKLQSLKCRDVEIRSRTERRRQS